MTTGIAYSGFTLTEPMGKESSLWTSAGSTSTARRSQATRKPVVKTLFMTRRNVSTISCRSMPMVRCLMYSTS